MSRKYHFIGIGGIGMSGLAKILVEKKSSVSGSDFSSNDRVEFLKTYGANVSIGHHSQNVPEGATVIYTSMLHNDNPELVEAKKKKNPLIHRSDLLHLLMQGLKPLLVTGTHGKTTTSALLAWVLEHAGFDPSYSIGGLILNNQFNARHGNGNYFVAEADESDGTFLKYPYEAAIVTNIDLDHMDFFGDEETLEGAFKKFMDKSSEGHLFFCSDDPRLRKLQPKGISYGFEEGAKLKGSNFQQNCWKIIFDLAFMDQKYSDIELPLIGFHNAQNALAVFGLCLMIGVPENQIRAAFCSFKGISRRQEKKAEIQGVFFIDDYAHHPIEIEATLKGIREAFPWRKIKVVFQPHRFSRTKACFHQFKEVFSVADELFITDIYGAFEAPIEGINSSLLVEEIKKTRNLPCHFVPRKQLALFVKNGLKPNDVVVTLGAGDITHLFDEIEEEIKKKPIPPIKLGVIFGGRSEECEVSLRSAENIIKHIDPEKYDLSYFAITRGGEWVTGESAKKVLAEKTLTISTKPKTLSPEILLELLSCDLLFPILHGPFGEDGKIQGLFETLRLKYVGCGSQSSAICMDKAVLKTLAAYHGLPVVPFIDFDRSTWNKNPRKILSQIMDNLHFPLFVKPVHLGSTIGISKVTEAKNLSEIIEKTFFYDQKILVENGLVAREIEFALFGQEIVKVFPPGEVLSSGAIYDFAAKYSERGFKVTSEAKLDQNLLKQGMDLAEKAYRIAGCDGFARVDFFLDEKEQFFLNEINPIPGFTKNSLYPQICERWGINITELVNILISLGLRKE